MKIIISERQQRLITENMTEENIFRLCYTIWDKQRKMGEEPNLDDVIYDITGIKKNTREDYDTIRPIWYEYNGGFDTLFEKLKDEINAKEYKLVEDEFDLETKIKVVHLDRQGQFVEIMVDVDPRGTIKFHGWDEENEEEFIELSRMIRSSVYDLFYNLLEKYGIPIDVDIDLQEIY